MITREDNWTNPTDAKLEDNLLEADFPFVDAENLNILASLHDGIVEDSVASDDEQIEA